MIHRNEKLVLAMAFVLFASLSPLQHANESVTRDFASESSSSVRACIDRARNGSTEECEVSQNDTKKRQARVVLKDLRITKNDKNEEKVEGTVVAMVKCTECKIEETSSAIDLRAIPIKDIAKIDQYLQQAKNEASKNFNEALSAKNKELACQVDEDGDDIKDTDTQAKLNCFKQKIADLDDKDKKKYVAKYVEPYFTDHVELGISQQALNGNPFAAHGMVAQWRQIGLSDTINGKLGLIDTVAQTRGEMLTYNSNNNRIALQYMGGLTSPDAKVRKAATVAYNQAMTLSAQDHFVKLLNGQAAMANSMSGLTTADPTMSSLSAGMTMQLNRNVQGMINTNKNLASTLGPNFTNNSLMNSGAFGTGFPGVGLGVDPLLMNSNAGVAAIFNTGLNTGFNTGNNWSQFPDWGSNLATDSGTKASFTDDAVAPAPSTPVKSSQTTAPVRTTSASGRTLSRMK